MSIRRDNNPPPATPHLHVTRVKRGQVIKAWILSVEVEGFWTHWTGRRSYPCQQNGAPCPAELHKLPQRWKGYLHVLPVDGEQDTIVEITPQAAREIKAATSHTPNLRGLMVELQRGNKSNNSRLHARLLIRHHDPQSLPGAKDPLPSLEHLWGTANDPQCTNEDTEV